MPYVALRASSIAPDAAEKHEGKVELNILELDRLLILSCDCLCACPLASQCRKPFSDRLTGIAGA